MRESFKEYYESKLDEEDLIKMSGEFKDLDISTPELITFRLK